MTEAIAMHIIHAIYTATDGWTDLFSPPSLGVLLCGIKCTKELYNYVGTWM